MTAVLPETTRVIQSTTDVLSETTRVIKSITAVLSEMTRVLKSMTAVLSETTRVLKSMTAVLSEITRVIKSITAVLSEMTRVLKSMTAVLSETTRVIKSMTAVLPETTRVIKSVACACHSQSVWCRACATWIPRTPTHSKRFLVSIRTSSRAFSTRCCPWSLTLRSRNWRVSQVTWFQKCLRCAKTSLMRAVWTKKNANSSSRCRCSGPIAS